MKIEDMSSDKVFLQMEVLLTKEIEKTTQKHGEKVGQFVRAMIKGTMLNVVVNCRLQNLNLAKTFIAFLETIAGWNAAIDELSKSK